MIHKPFASRSPLRVERSLSRRGFLRAAAGTLGALGAWPTAAWAAGRDPNPIPGGFTNPAGGPFVHHNLPGPADGPGGTAGGNDPSQITDFEGVIGQARVQGTGTGTDTATGNTYPLLFDADQRFMKGVYKSVDGRILEARLVFV